MARRDDGRDVGQRGVYREIAPGKRLVHTESWEDWNPGELLVTNVLDEHDGRTTLTNTILFPSAEVRDMLLKSGMDSGAEENYRNLADLLATLAAR